VTECLDAYDFGVTAILKMAHKRKKEDIKVICGIFRGDGFLQSLEIDDTSFFVADQVFF
jgi:hypothetical protein